MHVSRLKTTGKAEKNRQGWNKPTSSLFVTYRPNDNAPQTAPFTTTSNLLIIQPPHIPIQSNPRSEKKKAQETMETSHPSPRKAQEMRTIFPKTVSTTQHPTSSPPTTPNPISPNSPAQIVDGLYCPARATHQAHAAEN
ncbi:hypothetical protein EJ08DRAFT_707941 [Tothia fuscella]|uniref:Uncharacterized protein n=1 Tax=Tothia fuscella TaxID=1048955 RepID=A0A9P4NXG8_9PEZI|nr:hypothetical protein EJ08DRAFT_707941 [Tothia fuscella]